MCIRFYIHLLCVSACVWTTRTCRGIHVKVGTTWRSRFSPSNEVGSGEQTAKLGTVWHLITPDICAFTNVLLSYILHSVVLGCQR